MKIAFVTQPRDGIGKNTSLGIITIELALALSKEFEILIYGKRNQNIKEQSYENTKIKYKYVTIKLDDFIIKPVLKILNRLGLNRNKRMPGFASSFYYLIYASLIGLDTRIQNCPVIHIHNYSQFVPVIRFFNPKAKIVLHMNCEWLTQIHKPLIEKRLKKADLVLSCSDFVTQRNKEIFPGLKGLFHTLHNGVNTGEFTCSRTFKPEKNKRKILFTGRVSPEKGVHILVDAFNMIAEKFPELELEIIGPQGASSFITELDDNPVIKDLAHFYHGKDYFTFIKSKIKPELQDRVRFLGSVDHTKLPEYYRNSDIFVFPSVWNEPFGIPVVEAMASCLPVIAAKSGGITEILDNGTYGLTVECSNTLQLAGALELLLTDNDLMNRFAKAGKCRAEESFSWKYIAECLIKFYNLDLRKNPPAVIQQ
ncbi:MAG: glycosyltransferase family 4 protein [Bacillota bacterium]